MRRPPGFGASAGSAGAGSAGSAGSATGRWAAPRKGTEGTVTASGVRTAYWDFPAAPDSPVILMLHGFRGDHHGMQLIVDWLPGYRVIVPDLPGFGASEPFSPGPHSVANYVDFVASFARELRLGPETVLLGHSFGSILAAHLAAERPGLFDRLVLVNPICEPALEGAKGLLTKLAAFYYGAALRLPEKAGLALLRSPFIVRLMGMATAKTRDRELLAYIHDQHHRYFSIFSDRGMLSEAFQASTKGTVLEVAGDLQVPVLLIVGEKDDLGSVPAQRYMAGLIPDAELRLIPDVGHLVHYEKPAEAAACIEDFLERRR